MTTSFSRSNRGGKPIHLSGSRSSIKSGETVVSCGIPALDTLFNGGIGLGSVFLVGQDEHDSYSKYLVRYFLSDGIVHGHDLFCASRNRQSILESLPQKLETAVDENISRTSDVSTDLDADMKIAFRYKNLPAVDSSIKSAALGSCFDLKTAYSSEIVESRLRSSFTPQIKEDAANYDILLRELREIIKDHKYNNLTNISQESSEKVEKNILRIAVDGIGGPIWGPTHNLPGFISQLRLLIRDTYCICLVSIPLHLLSESIETRVLSNCDVGVRLESSGGVNHQYGIHHGLLHIMQLPHRHVLSCQSPACIELGFKLKRTQFAVERLHLPPALGDSDFAQPGVGSSCSSGKQNNKLDF